MPDSDEQESPAQNTQPVKKSRLSQFEGVIISCERVFDVLSTIITAIFTVVLARPSFFGKKQRT